MSKVVDGSRQEQSIPSSKVQEEQKVGSLPKKRNLCLALAFGLSIAGFLGPGMKESLADTKEKPSPHASVPTPGQSHINWQPWSDQIFAKAKESNRYVLLDLEAIWCHWCHVMDEKTYRTPKVIKLIG